MTTDAPPPQDDPNAATRRSWYLSAAVADDLAATVEREYFDLRGAHPKRAILDAVIRTGLAHLDEARKRVLEPPKAAAGE
jgi:hypothetical protein